MSCCLAIAVSHGCSASRANDGGGAGVGASGTGPSATGGETSSGTGGTLFGGGSSPGGGGGEGGACAGSSFKAEKLPLDMYIMLDQSGSMTDAVQGGGDKWGAVTEALHAFVSQPEAAGLGVGLQYFPLAGTPCPTECFTNVDCGPCGPCLIVIPMFPGICMNSGDDSCTPADYAKPEVAIATLPGVAAAIASSMSNHQPNGGTPTIAALQGALDYTTGWANAHLDHVVIIVLATDGDPTSCDTNLVAINAVAAKGAGATPKILTFVIGVGSSLTALNGIAAAGGTGQAFLVDTNQDVSKQFLEALNAIQGTALGCTYDIPKPESGTPDFGKVNVEYTPGGGGPTETFPKVGSAAECAPGSDGWYYDDEKAPSKIILCDYSCEKVSTDGSGKLDIVLGCATILK